MFFTIFNQILLQPVHSFTDAALQFLDRMAQELGLPMKKIEVCVGDGNRLIFKIKTVVSHIVGLLVTSFLHLGLPGQSCVNHDMGRVQPYLEIHLTEFSLRCCTCFPGMTSVSVNGIILLL